eukprot:SAG31_NODE_1910_length_6945_cov_45.108384_5_plen_201_part_00
MACCVHYDWTPAYFDAKTAFLNGSCQEHERVGVRLPSELRQYDPDTNEEVYGILEKSLYGHPIASLRWSQARDAFTMKKFNSDGWTCICIVDREPCLFYMISPRTTDNRIMMVIHTDDFRIAGDNTADVAYVVQAFDDEFGIKTVTDGIMLGIKITHGVDDNGVRWTELTQTAYIEEMYAMALPYLPPNYKVSCPYPPEH